MRTPAAAAAVRAWVIRCVLIMSGVVLGLLVAAGPAQADSPLDLGKTVDKVATTVHKATSPAKKATRSARAATASKPRHKATSSLRQVAKPVRQATKAVRQATQPAHKTTRPVRKITRPAHKITQPARKITKAARKITKAARTITKPARHVTHRDRDKADRPKPATPARSERATKPEPPATSKAATKPRTPSKTRTAYEQHPKSAEPTPATSSASTTGDASSLVEQTPILVGAVTSTTSDLLVIEGAAVDSASRVLSNAGGQLPGPLSTVITDGVVTPVDTIHDAALVLVDDALTITVPAVVDRVTAPLLPVLDEIGEALPPHAVPGPPNTADVPPIGLIGDLVGPPWAGSLSVPDARAGLDDALGARTPRPSASDDRVTVLGGVALFGIDASAGLGSGSSPESSMATSAGLLLNGAAHSLQNGLGGVGPSGSATAIALGLGLLALASSGAFGPGAARAVRVVGLQDRPPYRRAHRPGFSPD